MSNNLYKTIEPLYHKALNDLMVFLFENDDLNIKDLPGYPYNIMLLEEKYISSNVSTALLTKLNQLDIISRKTYFITSDLRSMIQYDSEKMVSTKNPITGESISKKQFTEHLKPVITILDFNAIKESYLETFVPNKKRAEEILKHIDSANIDISDFKAEISKIQIQEQIIT